MKGKFILALLVIIILFGGWLRLHGILSNSFAFTYDVGRDLLAVKRIVEEHDIMLIGPTTGLEGLFYGPAWYYILVPAFFLSGGDPQAVAGFIALTGIVGIFGAYVIGKKISGDFLGVTFAALFACSPPLIEYTTQIWSPDLIPGLLIAALYFLVFILKKNTTKDRVLFFLVGLALGLIIDMEIVFGLLLTAGVVLGLVLIYKKKLRLLSSLAFVIGIALSFASRIVFEFLHNFLMTRSIFGALSHMGNEGYLFSPVLNISHRFMTVLGLFANTVTGGNILLASLFIIVSIYVLWKTNKKTPEILKRFFILCISVTGIFIVGLSFFSHAIWDHYLTGLPVIFVLFVSLILYTIKEHIHKGKEISLSLLTVLLLLSINPMRLYETIATPLWEGNAAVYRNQVAAVDYVYQEAKGEKFKYIVYTPALLDYPYRYLFTWYGPKKYNYQPTQENNKLFFVILEPDHEQPLRQKDWLKQREGDGRVVKEQKVKGGIVVQTRVIK